MQRCNFRTLSFMTPALQSSARVYTADPASQDLGLLSSEKVLILHKEASWCVETMLGLKQAGSQSVSPTLGAGVEAGASCVQGQPRLHCIYFPDTDVT